jgi:hypothetical protein
MTRERKNCVSTGRKSGWEESAGLRRDTRSALHWAAASRVEAYELIAAMEVSVEDGDGMKAIRRRIGKGLCSLDGESWKPHLQEGVNSHRGGTRASLHSR